MPIGLDNFLVILEKNKLDSYLILHIQINSRWNQDLTTSTRKIEADIYIILSWRMSKHDTKTLGTLLNKRLTDFNLQNLKI